MHKRILILLVALMLVLAACGGGDDAGDTTTAAPGTTTEAPQDTTTTAATTTTEAATTTAAPATTEGPSDAGSLSVLTNALSESTDFQSARMEGSILMSGAPDLEGEFELAFSGEFADEENFSFTMDLGSIAAAAGEEIPPEFADLFDELAIRQIGETTYLKFGFFSMLGVETEWISFPTEEGAGGAGGFAGITEGFTGGANPTNPAEFLAGLEEADAEVTELGTEDVRGVATTHYRAVFDVEKLSEEAAEELAGDLPAGSFPDGLPVDFWIGDDGRIYRYVIDIDGSEVVFESSEESFDRMVLTYEIFDYGADIVIEAPPADQVTDGSELGGLFEF